MTITLSKSVEERISSLPQEVIEEALIGAAEKHEQEKALSVELLKGINDLEKGRFIEFTSDEDLQKFLRNGRERALAKVGQ